MKRGIAVLGAAALLAGCSDRPAPTGLDSEATAQVVEKGSSSILASALPPPLIPVEDALARVMDGLPDAPAKDELRAALQSLAAALEANDSCVIRTSRRHAEHALRDLGRRAPAEFEPDLEVAKLALESVEETSTGRCTG
jgi:hypothetical protein